MGGFETKPLKLYACPADAWKSFTDTLSGIGEQKPREAPKEAPKPTETAAVPRKLPALTVLHSLLVVASAVAVEA